MRIMLISSLFPPGIIGGYELAAFDVAKGLKEKGYDIHVVASNYHCEFKTEIKDFPVYRKLEYFPLYSHYNDADETVYKNFFVNFRNIFAINQLINEIQPDKVLLFDTRGLGTVSLLRYFTQLGYNPTLYYGDNLFSGLEGHLDKLNAYITMFGPINFLSEINSIFVSKRIAKEVSNNVGMDFINKTILPGWFIKSKNPTRIFSTKNSNNITNFVFASQLESHKGIYILLDSVAKLVQMGELKFKVDIYGSGNISAVNAKISENNLSQYIKYQRCADKSEMCEIFSKYEALVLPSWEREPFGLVVSEAASAGCVPIMTDVGAAEWFHNDEDCIIISRDSDSLAAAMIRFMHMLSDEKKDMSEKASAIAEKYFNFSNLIDQIEKVINDARPSESLGRRNATLNINSIIEKLSLIPLMNTELNQKKDVQPKMIFFNFLKKFPFLRKMIKFFFCRFPRLGRWIYKKIFQASVIDKASDSEVKRYNQNINNSIINGSKKTVLLLSNYPYKIPRTGGQIRSKTIFDRYVKEGYTCIPLVVREESNYVGESDPAQEVIFPDNSPYRLYKNIFVPFISEYSSGIFAVESLEVMKAICRRIDKKIDVIHVEGPFLFKLGQKLKNEVLPMKDSKLVYSSQNIEYKLKADMLSCTNISSVIKSTLIADIKSLELDAVKQADLVLAVSNEDKDFLEKESGRQVILGVNAAHKQEATSYSLELWRKKLPSKYFVFVGSAHQPNVVGFFSMLEHTEGSLSEEIKIVIVGNVSVMFETSHQYVKNKSVDKQKLILLGMVTDEDLAAVLALAHAVLIPIISGGGTNLKTAEALLSGKYIVSTSKGFRGYEQYINVDRGVFIGNTPEEFQKNMQVVWELPSRDLSNRCGQDLTWDYALNDFFVEMNK